MDAVAKKKNTFTSAFKYLGSTVFGAIILLFLAGYFYTYFGHPFVEATYAKENNSNSYIYHITIRGSKNIDLRETLIRISDFSIGSRNKECYQLDLGHPVNLTTRAAKCDLERVSDNYLILDCSYIDAGFGSIELDWRLTSPPEENCSFHFGYSPLATYPFPLGGKSVKFLPTN